MNIVSVIKFFGGLGLFLYGMTLMGNSLEQMAGEKLEKTLEKLTGTVYKSVIVGMLVTGIIQSSSATTVMVVGFVNGGIMTLKQAVGIIMGANIGTTVTALLISLDNSNTISSSIAMQLLKPSNFSFLLVFIGVVLLFFVKKKKVSNFGSILVGVGILFIGMNIMESSVSVLRESEAFISIFATLSNPILGILAGALITGVIQSSSASVGILQAAATTGAVTYSSAVPIILGQNIGTCVTALLSSIGATKNAKRAAMIHLYFNLIGTVIFIIAIYTLKAFIDFPFWGDSIDKAGIARFHILFNVSTTVLFIPFNKLLVTLAEKTIKIEEKPQPSQILNILDSRFYQTPVIALEQCHKVILEMGNSAIANIKSINKAIVEGSEVDKDVFKDNENFLDKAETRLNQYMPLIKDEEFSDYKKKQYNELMQAISDFERIGDYTVNIYEQYNSMKENNIVFSDRAVSEINIMRDAVEEVMELTIEAFKTEDIDVAKKVEPLEDIIDAIKKTLKSKHITRLQQGKCNVDVGLPYLELIHNYEKIADHCSNVAIYVIILTTPDQEFDKHEYHKNEFYHKEAYFKELTSFYENKYLFKLG